MLKCFFFFQAEDGIRDLTVTGVQTCALPISPVFVPALKMPVASARSFLGNHSATALMAPGKFADSATRSEEHTSELQSQSNLVCRLLLEKKKKTTSAMSPRATRDTSRRRAAAGL